MTERILGKIQPIDLFCFFFEIFLDSGGVEVGGFNQIYGKSLKPQRPPTTKIYYNLFKSIKIYQNLSKFI